MRPLLLLLHPPIHYSMHPVHHHDLLREPIHQKDQADAAVSTEIPVDPAHHRDIRVTGLLLLQEAALEDNLDIPSKEGLVEDNQIEDGDDTPLLFLVERHHRQLGSWEAWLDDDEDRACNILPYPLLPLPRLHPWE